VYSVDGRRVRTLVRESREPGEYQATWDGRDDGGNPISAGVYYARLETVDRQLIRAITYLK
jgi:flagellar hook assembly protein FlgD